MTGQELYDAHRDLMGDLNIPLVVWDELSAETKAGWEQSAQDYITKKMDDADA